MTVAFIEEKSPDLTRVAALLGKSASKNRWANRGPLYDELSHALIDYVACDAGLTMVPMANGGVALEALARFHSLQAGRRLKWMASAFSFRNIGRGYFHDALIVDCGEDGLLDLEACANLDPQSFDGIIVTNPFGLHGDFRKYADFASRLGKPMLIDNASGFHSRLPDFPWQAFSFHHTKPYGVGEGGAAIAPREHLDVIYGLIDYASDLSGSPHWLGNGKISDLSCAFILERLEKADSWVPEYLQQQERLAALSKEVGFSLLAPPQNGLPMTSLPLISPRGVPESSIRSAKHMTLGKYYKPLSNTPRLSRIFKRLVNVPCHPNIARLNDAHIRDDLDRLAGHSEATSRRSRRLARSVV